MCASIFKNVMNFFNGDNKKKKEKKAVQLPSNLPSLVTKPKGKVYLDYQGEKEILWSCQLANAMKQQEIFCSKAAEEKQQKIITHKLKKTLVIGQSVDEITLVKPLLGLGGNDLSKETFYFALNQTSETLKTNLKNGFKIIGFSSSDSHCDGTRKVGRLWYESSKTTQTNKQMDPREMISMIKSGTVDFEFMEHIFKNISGMLGNPMLSSMGFNITPEMKEKITYQSERGTQIYNSMTKRERCTVELLTDHSSATSRIKRISRGSGVSIEDINKHIEMVKLFRSKGSNIAELMSNPSKLKEIMSKMGK